MENSDTPVYEARYGFDRRTALMLAVSALFTLLLLLQVGDFSLGWRIAGLVLFGGGGLLMAAGALTRKTAFRVDDTGVLLGGSPMRYRATTVHVPWQDITAVVVWRQRVESASVQWVGVARREGAPLLPGPMQGPVALSAVEALARVPGELVASSRGVVGWRLDKSRLAAAVAHFAPGVEVITDE